MGQVGLLVVYGGVSRSALLAVRAPLSVRPVNDDDHLDALGGEDKCNAIKHVALSPSDACKSKSGDRDTQKLTETGTHSLMMLSYASASRLAGTILIMQVVLPCSCGFEKHGYRRDSRKEV